MLPATIIAKKRDRQALSRDEIQFMIRGLTDGRIPDYQIAAWAMAILCRGMDSCEIADLTHAMLDSGCRLGRASDRPRVDKHSTGGLGDKVSLILAPLLALFDVDVPMLSGRGLGITGGTLDKLESYSGYRCDLSLTEIDRQLADIGCAITGTTADIAPADRKLYALRDVTATVPSVALITSSIMCKKLAATLDALVLDVKVGSGAFMQSYDAAVPLADSLRATGASLALPTITVLSDMNQPLGRMVGNACEANEAVEVLQGGGPHDVRTLTLRLGAELLLAIGRFRLIGEAEAKLAEYLDQGSAFERFSELIHAQRGTLQYPLPLASAHTLESTRGGWITRIDGQAIGTAVIALGGGRQRQGDRIDHTVGLEMLVRLGDAVEPQQPIARIFARSEDSATAAAQLAASAIHIASAPIRPPPLVYDFPPPADPASAPGGVDR